MRPAALMVATWTRAMWWACAVGSSAVRRHDGSDIHPDRGVASESESPLQRYARENQRLAEENLRLRQRLVYQTDHMRAILTRQGQREATREIEDERSDMVPESCPPRAH